MTEEDRLDEQESTEILVKMLRHRDTGLGLTLFHLIRPSIQEQKLRERVEWVERRGPIVHDRTRRAIMKALSELECGIPTETQRWICRSFGQPQSCKAQITISCGRDGDLWFGVYDGLPALSRHALLEQGGYQTRQSLIRDLERIAALSNWNRVLYSSRVFALYYGTDDPEEVAWQAYTMPQTYASLARSIILPNAVWPERKKRFIVRSNERTVLSMGSGAGPIPADLAADTGNAVRIGDLMRKYDPGARVQQVLDPIIQIGHPGPSVGERS